MLRRPGGELSRRPLHFIWIIDCSDSMLWDEKIQALNQTIRESIPHMRAEADNNPNIDLLVRAIQFSDGARWHVAKPTPIADFEWTDLSAGGGSDIGKALSMVAEELKTLPLPDRALPPVLVLISDGRPTDDFEYGLNAILKQPLGKKAFRLAAAIDRDADLDVLQKFMGHTELKPIQANNGEAIFLRISWYSVIIKDNKYNDPGCDIYISTNRPFNRESVEDVW